MFNLTQKRSISTDTIYVTIRYSYKNTRRIYPVCDTGQLFARLAGTVTLTDKTIKQVKELGYTVKVLQESDTL